MNILLRMYVTCICSKSMLLTVGGGGGREKVGPELSRLSTKVPFLPPDTFKESELPSVTKMFLNLLENIFASWDGNFAYATLTTQQCFHTAMFPIVRAT